MKSYLYITLLFCIVSISSWANYIPESQVASGPSGPVFMAQAKCREHYQEACIKLPSGYSKEYHRLVNTKSDSEVCFNDSDCQSKLEAKRCSDGEELAIKVLDSDPKEVYCTKKQVSINAGLKSAYDAQKAATDSLENALSQTLKAQQCGKRVMAMMLVRNAQKALSKAQKRLLVQTYKDIKDLLDVGSLEAAREDILAVNADGTLVTEADKTALVQTLDGCQ